MLNPPDVRVVRFASVGLIRLGHAWEASVRIPWHWRRVINWMQLSPKDSDALRRADGELHSVAANLLDRDHDIAANHDLLCFLAL